MEEPVIQPFMPNRFESLLEVNETSEYFTIFCLMYMFVNKGIYMVSGAVFWEEANLAFAQDGVFLKDI